MTGRVRNISGKDLHDTWVLIQIFNHLEELITFEEVPLPINPIPIGGTSPFKAVFDGDLLFNKVFIMFKNASGYPISALESRKKMEWVGMIADVDKGLLSSSSLPSESKDQLQIDVIETFSELDIKLLNF